MWRARELRRIREDAPARSRTGRGSGAPAGNVAASAGALEVARWSRPLAAALGWWAGITHDCQLSVTHSLVVSDVESDPPQPLLILHAQKMHPEI